MRNDTIPINPWSCVKRSRTQTVVYHFPCLHKCVRMKRFSFKFGMCIQCTYIYEFNTNKTSMYYVFIVR